MGNVRSTARGNDVVVDDDDKTEEEEEDKEEETSLFPPLMVLRECKGPLYFARCCTSKTFAKARMYDHFEEHRM